MRHSSPRRYYYKEAKEIEESMVALVSTKPTGTHWYPVGQIGTH